MRGNMSIDEYRQVRRRVDARIEHVKFKVTDAQTGEVEYVEYPSVFGRVLVPATECERYNMSRSKLTEFFQTGRLTPYTRNGMIKRSQSNQAVYFDLNEWTKMDLNDTEADRRREPVTVEV